MQERIEELLQAIDDKDWDKLSAIFHEDIIYERPGYQPLVGIGQVLQFYEKERLIFGSLGIAVKTKPGSTLLPMFSTT